MPNVSARIGFTDELQLRLAYTQTRTRPNFFDLRPNLSLRQPVILAPGDPCLDDPTTEECVERLRRGGSAGNPDLKPLTPNHHDAGPAYYFSPTVLVSAPIFRNDHEVCPSIVADRSAGGRHMNTASGGCGRSG